MRLRSSKVFSALLIAAAALAAWGLLPTRRAQADEPRFFAIRGARIVPVSGAPIESGTVVIARGLIQAVGANVTIPPEAEVLDGAGLTIYPGFIDAGTDVGLEAPAPAAAAGGRAGGGGGGRGAAAAANVPNSHGAEDRPATTPWLDAADELHADDRRIESWRNAGITTALVLPRNGIFPGQGAIVDLAGGERASNMVVKPGAALPVNFAGGRGQYQGFPGALMGQLAYVHQVFLDAHWYADAEKLYAAHPAGTERPRYDHTDAVISEAIREGELVLVPAESSVQILRALRLAPDWGVKWALYGAQQGYENSDAIAAAKIPVVVGINWPTRDRNQDDFVTQHESLRTLRFRDRAPSTPAALAKAGVKFAFSTEGITNSADILRNLNKSVTAGLSPDAALRALTADAAEILGAGKILGSIEPGKIANLTITNGDIFKEGTAVKWVFVDGRRYEVREQPSPQNGRGARGESPMNSDDGSSRQLDPEVRR